LIDYMAATRYITVACARAEGNTVEIVTFLFQTNFNRPIGHRYV